MLPLWWSIRNRSSSALPADDVCPYQPYDSLVAFYTTEVRQYDKAWDFVHRAREAGVRIQPELVDRLKNNSGRTD